MATKRRTRFRARRLRETDSETEKILTASPLASEKDSNDQANTLFQPQRVSPETESNGNPGEFRARVSSILSIQRFFVREKKLSNDDNVKIFVSSLHGYSSLEMLRYGHKSCAKKVSALYSCEYSSSLCACVRTCDDRL